MMGPETKPPPPADVFAYLRSTGWDFLENVRGWTRWRLVKEGVGELVLQASTQGQAPDYSIRFSQLVDDLRRVEERDEEHLVRDIRSSASDVIKIRVAGAAGDGRIPVDDGARLFKDARDLLLAAACATVQKRAAFSRKKPERAMEYLKRTQFGPTEAGSFVITIESPVPPKLASAQLADELAVDESDPFDRRVNTTLARAALAARRIVDEVSASNATDGIREGIEHGLTSNLCDAIASFVSADTPRILDLRFRWAASRPAPNLPREVRFDSVAGPVLQVMAKQLREEGTFDDYELFGPVYKFKSDDPSLGGTVWIVAMEGHAKRKLVSLDLSASDYQLAMQAHAEKRWVDCTGELDRARGAFHLRHARGLSLHLDDEPEE